MIVPFGRRGSESTKAGATGKSGLSGVDLGGGERVLEEVRFLTGPGRRIAGRFQLREPAFERRRAPQLAEARRVGAQGLDVGELAHPSERVSRECGLEHAAEVALARAEPDRLRQASSLRGAGQRAVEA